jgi:hypothetical protein
MNKIANLHTQFYSGYYEEFNEFCRIHPYCGYSYFLEEVYKLKCILDENGSTTNKFIVLDDSLFMMFMIKYPEFVKNVTYE